ncbi:hypothetical protein B0T22DRAFT_463368 [Podospora appendiculata]|uniref:Uncharacterized protein n=1 Tax=Podospora appendiculata TaxID=314037 RepID=A0AAE1CE82_9PEZI|nr:hypothetical protein B0T22DRAFT_463368 [Podospora appendiculata]
MQSGFLKCVQNVEFSVKLLTSLCPNVKTLTANRLHDVKWNHALPGFKASLRELHGRHHEGHTKFTDANRDQFSTLMLSILPQFPNLEHFACINAYRLPFSPGPEIACLTSLELWQCCFCDFAGFGTVLAQVPALRRLVVESIKTVDAPGPLASKVLVRAPKLEEFHFVYWSLWAYWGGAVDDVANVKALYDARGVTFAMYPDEREQYLLRHAV